jgi:hypothetical protein
MATMDVFKGDAFSMMSLLAAIKNVDYKPSFLGSLKLFNEAPQDTRVVAIESVDETLSLISTSVDGAPPAQLSATKRKLRNFQTVRLAKASTIKAAEVQNIRAFGSETELMQVQAEVASRLSRLVNDLELTLENHRLGAIQGIVVDADGSTEIVNFYTEFGVAQDSDDSINFTTIAVGSVRPYFEAIRRSIIRSGKGLVTNDTKVYALVGDDYWDGLVNHSEVRQLYLNTMAAQEALGKPTAFGTFTFAGITFVNYRGTDDNSTVAIGAKNAKFFCDAPGLFQVAWGRGEFIDAPPKGVPQLPLVLPDPSGRNAFVSVEIYSYPLYVCTRPGTLRRAQCA